MTRTTAATHLRSRSVCLALSTAALAALGGCGTDAGDQGGSSTSPASASSSATPQSRMATSGGPAPTTTTPSSAPSGPGAAPAPAADAARAGARRPVYLVGTEGENGGPRPELRLFREYVVVPQGSAPGTPADRAATQDVAAAMASAPGFEHPWGERGVQRVTRAADGITVVLEDGPRLDAARGKVAVAGLVWTATASYGADVPVRVTTAGGRPIAPGIASGSVHRRSSYDPQAVLAGLWIDSPGEGQRVRPGKVTVFGQASVWEANVIWSLTRGGAGVKRGVTTATVGAPARGSWKVDLGTLSPGTYTITVSAESPADGRTTSRARHTFTVR